MTHTFTRRDIIERAGGLALATPFLSLAACDGADRGRPLSRLSGATMGTTYQISITDKPAHVNMERLAEDVENILETVNRQMSLHRPDSELSRFNAGEAETLTAVSGDTAKVAAQAIDIAERTNGAFDPTIGPLVDLWGFGAGGDGLKVPSADQIQKVRAETGFATVQARAAPPRLRKRARSTHLDLCGIAKGFGVDRLADHLEAIGAGYYLVEIGGELRGRGWSPRGGVWRVGIERPGTESGGAQRVVRLNGKGLATSGDYRIFFEKDGRHYSHILDPRTGRPVNHGLASVTVIAPTTMEADGLSTAMMVLGAVEGLKLAERETIAAFFITRQERGFSETASTAFLPYLVA
ncbi:MAG: FAD:protein FMN transferase [Alphaproteobacteria bacterium]|nr:FAD:protein FMN transferase [Alphaproteobacteria bacterium]